MSEYSLVNVNELDRAKLDKFLCHFYGKPKSKFLGRHGKWWYRGDQHRWAILADEQIAAYCGIIPTKCLIGGTEGPAWWWVDLTVAPRFRGKGLQTIFDREIRKNGEVKLGFPNELASRIHKKHGWGLREDLQVLMLPLRPLKVKNIYVETGLRGSLLRLAALGSTPLASLGCQWLKRYRPLAARVVEDPSPDIFESVFERYKDDGTVTTYRDAEYFKWRFADAPYRSELVFYLAGPSSSPTHFLVARHVRSLGSKATRILDVFGDFHDLEGLGDIVRLAVKDAISEGSSQVNALVTLPELHSLLRSVGFLISVKARFCWLSDSPIIMRSLKMRSYWTLADSDNDPPVNVLRGFSER